MRKIVLAIVILSLAVLSVGCQSMTRDEDQNIRKYSRIAELNRRMLAEDVDAILLLDRPSALTEYNVRPE